ncbi:MAG: IclR family transcriptional regulator C-terminal domain-containing protein [Chloroflexi bacterium]|nr:IclR family transcriptional regulator C-terminal domain-containing protein [Chloroflexota bacterium]
MATFTVNTITRPVDLRREGFAMTYDEHTMDWCSVAGPICDYTGEVVAALAVSWPSYRLSRARLTTISRDVRATAAAISAALGSSRLSERGDAS